MTGSTRAQTNAHVRIVAASDLHTIELSGLTVSDRSGGVGRFRVTLDLDGLNDLRWVLENECGDAEDSFGVVDGHIAWIDGTRSEVSSATFFWEGGAALSVCADDHLLFALDRAEADLLCGALRLSAEGVAPVHVAAVAAAAGLSAQECREAVSSTAREKLTAMATLAALRGTVIHPPLEGGDVLVLH